ncbi:MAG TPA: nitroreductase family deazaflavin-dependent oxidoreductase, partial [Chloroflexota bacterium]|nr:nitroreductase family deazaflavin-dependent oxidoreductase [Chloroflexota bacterium]
MTTVSPGLEAAPAAKPATPSPPQPPRARPSPFVRWLLRVPPALYRLGLARQAGKRFLLLTTSGRKTGRRYTCALSYVRTAAAIYVFAGWGPRSDWYRNALADPDVSVQLGTDLWQAMAHPIDDPDERARLLRRMAEGADA